jgi:hypothetical protein
MALILSATCPGFQLLHPSRRFWSWGSRAGSTVVLGAGLEPESARGKSRVRWHGAVKTFVKQDVVIARIPL